MSSKTRDFLMKTMPFSGKRTDLKEEGKESFKARV
jgi:hypothetical protein